MAGFANYCIYSLDFLGEFAILAIVVS